MEGTLEQSRSTTPANAYPFTANCQGSRRQRAETVNGMRHGLCALRRPGLRHLVHLRHKQRCVVAVYARRCAPHRPADRVQWRRSTSTSDRRSTTSSARATADDRRQPARSPSATPTPARSTTNSTLGRRESELPDSQDQGDRAFQTSATGHRPPAPTARRSDPTLATNYQDVSSAAGRNGTRFGINAARTRATCCSRPGTPATASGTPLWLYHAR